MAHNILDDSCNDLALHQDQFEIKDEFQEDSNNKTYRVKKYVPTLRNNFSKSCRIIASCAAICIITVMTIVIIVERQNSATKTIIEVIKDNLHKTSSDDTHDRISKKSTFKEIVLQNNATYNQNELLNESNKTSEYYFLQEILLSDNDKLWLFDLQNKSLSLFHEAESTIDTFEVFTKQEIFFSSFQAVSAPIYSFSGYENKSNKTSFDVIFNEIRFRPRGIAFDFASKNIYAVDEDMGTLIVLNLNTKLFTLLLTDLIQPRNIYVDPPQGIMFILQVSHSILKGDMNGENLHNVIHRTGITAMTLDIVNKRIYWVNDIVGIESSDYNGEHVEQFPTNTATIIDLAIVDDKLYWIWQNHHNPNVHHLLYCTINSKYCVNHEMHLLKNLHNLTTIRTIYGQNLSKITSFPCEVENGGCEQLCFSIPNEKFSCACKLGWQLKPDKKTCYEISNFILYMSKNIIRGHLLDVTGRTSTEVILPTLYEVDYFNNTVRFDYDQLNDNIYFSDGKNIYRNKIRNYKYQQHIKLLSNSDTIIIDITYDRLTKNLYSYECLLLDDRNYPDRSERQYSIKTFQLDEQELILKNTKNFQSVSRLCSGINVHPKKQLLFFIEVDGIYQNSRYEYVHEIFKTYNYSKTQMKLATAASSIGLLKRPIAIDFQENKLYWIENEPKVVVKCMNFDGSGVKKIIVDEFITATYIFVYRQWVYLANDETIWRVYKKSGKGAIELVSKSGIFNDIRLISNDIV